MNQPDFVLVMPTLLFDTVQRSLPEWTSFAPCTEALMVCSRSAARHVDDPWARRQAQRAQPRGSGLMPATLLSAKPPMFPGNPASVIDAIDGLHLRKVGVGMGQVAAGAENQHQAALGVRARDGRRGDRLQCPAAVGGREQRLVVEVEPSTSLSRYGSGRTSTDCQAGRPHRRRRSRRLR